MNQRQGLAVQWTEATWYSVPKMLRENYPVLMTTVKRVIISHHWLVRLSHYRVCTEKIEDEQKEKEKEEAVYKILFRGMGIEPSPF